jgi:sulfatase modifying factor 1
MGQRFPRRCAWLSTCVYAAFWIAGALGSFGETARFFRVVGPVQTTITEFRMDGTLVWTNTPTNAVFVIQTAGGLNFASNWVNYAQISSAAGGNALRLVDFSPPVKMVFIPEGIFTMGDTLGESLTLNQEGEWPAHEVYLRAFYMDQYEVTKAVWDSVRSWGMGNGYTDLPTGGGKGANHPIQTISWYAAVKWCNARSQQEGLTPCYYSDVGLSAAYKTGSLAPYVNWDATGYRLPTEAEWEKAARGGSNGKRFPWSDSDKIQNTRANYYSDTNDIYDTSGVMGYNPIFNDGVYPYTSPVGYFAPNGYGLYEMAGNVGEWCWDLYSSDYYSASPTNNPHNDTSGSRRVVRGGGWFDRFFSCRVANRISDYPAFTWYNFGFRCVRTTEQ